MSTQRLDLQIHSLMFIALGGADPVAVSIGISCSPVDLAASKVRRVGREAVVWFAGIGPRSRASSALGSLRSRMRHWPAQDGWYLIPVQDGRAFRRSFGTVVENYSQLDCRKAIQSIDLQEYLRQRQRPDFTFSSRVNAPSRKREATSEV
jgi:hypothetical protein